MTFILFTIFSGLVAQKNRAKAASYATRSCQEQACPQIDAAILSTTVCIHLQAWRVKQDESGYFVDESIGHATVMDGRFLVTHNHYSLLEQADLPESSISVAIFDAKGRHLFSAPLTDFSVTPTAAETCLFELKYEYWQDKLAAAGIQSAQFANWQQLDLQPGMEVAQVDWDGRSTRLDWTRIEQVITEDGVPRLVVGDGVAQGGSGGGIFWNGKHIANNWQYVEHLDGDDNIIYVTGIAALNTRLKRRLD